MGNNASSQQQHLQQQLITAASRGDVRRCHALLARGAVVHSAPTPHRDEADHASPPSGEGEEEPRRKVTPLHQAVIHNRREVVKLFITAGADVNLKADVTWGGGGVGER